MGVMVARVVMMLIDDHVVRVWVCGCRFPQ